MITRRVHTPAEWDRVLTTMSLVRSLRTAGSFFPYPLDTYPWLVRPLVALWRGIPDVVIFLVRTFIFWGPLVLFRPSTLHWLHRWWVTLPAQTMLGLTRLVHFPAQALLVVLDTWSAGTIILPIGLIALWLLITFARYYQQLPTVFGPLYRPLERWASGWEGGAGIHFADDENAIADTAAKSAWVLRHMQREARQWGTPPPQRVGW